MIDMNYVILNEVKDLERVEIFNNPNSVKIHRNAQNDMLALYVNQWRADDCMMNKEQQKLCKLMMCNAD